MTSSDALNEWLEDITLQLIAGEDPVSQNVPSFLEIPEQIEGLLENIASIDEASLTEDQTFFSACLFALDVCVSQLKFSIESGNRQAQKMLDNLMASLVTTIQEGKQSINFWLPLMGVFYDAQIPLSDDLQAMYLTLAEEESEKFQLEGFDHLESMRELIGELGDVSPFELTAHFFAQSHAMPPDFFADLVIDLCQIEEAKDSAILALLHPNPEVREIVLLALDSVMPNLTISSESLSRLQAIQVWLPDDKKATLEYWIRMQRKQGVIFPRTTPEEVLKIQGSEIDGGGAEGLFLQIKAASRVRLAGLLLKGGIGIKDAWITPTITKTEARKYYQQVLDDGVSLRTIDMTYLTRVANHFLAMTIDNEEMPNLHFLELQEVLGIHFLPEKMKVDDLMEELSIQIQPFTQSVVERALQHTADWLEEKPFAVSWFIESEHLDKIVNRCSSIEEGVKICRFDEAIEAAFEHVLEPTRDRWLFHFLWVALWLRAGARKHEKVWQACFLIAHAIQTDMPLADIPIMRAICRQSIVNSVETMRERRTHLSQE